MKKVLLLSFFLTAYNIVISQNFTISVTSSGEPLPYPEIRLSNKIHRLGDGEGKLVVSMNLFSSGDTLHVSYMGFKDSIILINDSLIKQKSIIIPLEEKTYILNDIIIGRNNVNAEKLYDKKKKIFLLPYYKPYHCETKFEYFVNKKNITQANINSRFYHGHITLDSITLINDTAENRLLRRLLKRTAELNYFSADIFCNSKNINKFYCDYKGEQNGLFIWLFTIRPRNNTIFVNLQPKDDLVCLVSLDNKGFIKRIETLLTKNNSSDNTFSYILETDYETLDNKVINSNSKMTVLPNSNYDNTERILTVNYSQIKKEK